MPRDIIAEAQRFQSTKQLSNDELDNLFEDAVRLVAQHEKASASLLQRRLSVGYARAARLLDQLEAVGVIGYGNGSEPREVLISSYEEYQNKSFKQPTQNPTSADSEPDFNSYKAPDWKTMLIDGAWKKMLSRLSEVYKTSPLSFPVGWDQDHLVTESLLHKPHLIITGNPQSNKLAYLDSFLTSLLSFESPANLRFVLLDGARNLHVYKNVPHLLTPVTAEADKALAAVRWGHMEMEHRFNIFTKENCRDISEYHKTGNTRMCHIVYVITQVDDYMSYAPKELSDSLKLLTSKGARAGIHIILVSDNLASHSIPNEIQENISTVISFKSTWSGKSTPKDTEDLKPGELLYKNDKENTLTKLVAPLILESEVLSLLK